MDHRLFEKKFNLEVNIVSNLSDLVEDMLNLYKVYQQIIKDGINNNEFIGDLIEESEKLEAYMFICDNLSNYRAKAKFNKEKRKIKLILNYDERDEAYFRKILYAGDDLQWQPKEDSESHMTMHN